MTKARLNWDEIGHPTWAGKQLDGTCGYLYGGFVIRVFGNVVAVTKDGETHCFSSLDLAMKQVDDWRK